MGESWVPSNNEFSSGNDNIYSHDGISFKEGRLDERRFLQFQSRSLRTHERNYGPTKLEGLGLSWALASADEIIRNCSDVIVYTDHQALLHIFQHDNNLLNKTLSSWADTILNYNFKLQYVKVLHNVLPDLLSRMYKRNHSDIEIFENEPTLKTMTIQVDPDMDNLHFLEDKLEQQRLIQMYHQRGHFGIRHIVKLIHAE